MPGTAICLIRTNDDGSRKIILEAISDDVKILEPSDDEDGNISGELYVKSTLWSVLKP